jgi:hypothetical protein
MFHSREAFIAVAAYGRPYGIVLGALRRTECRAELVGLALWARPPYLGCVHRSATSRNSAERGAV